MAYIAEPYAQPEAVPAPPPKKEPPLEKVRYTSIDALKGLSVLALLLVNASLANPALPAQLKPGSWGNPTFADCVLPALIVGIGAGIPLCAAFRKDRESLGRYLLGAISKAFWLVLFGVLMESAAARQPVLDCGALQLIGIAYLINALLARTPVILRVFLAEALLLIIYVWAKLTVYPGTMAGTFTEAQNIIQFYDDKFFAPIGLQGLLALVPITSIMMSGSVIGSLYHLDESRIRRGLIVIGCGGTVTFFGWLWSRDQPMAPTIWTSSYALFTTGIAVVALGLLMMLFDFEKGAKIAYPITVPGRCIILAMVGPVLLKTMILDSWHWPGTNNTLSVEIKHYILGAFTPPLVDWVYPIGWMMSWWIILAIAHHRRQWNRRRHEPS